MPRVVKPAQRFSWRLTLTILAWTTLAASAAMAAKSVQHYVLTDSHFALSPPSRALTFEGVHYTSRARLAHVFAADFGQSVFHSPMDERRRHLLAIDWVQSASISRIWPNRLVVRIEERKPVAFASLDGGNYLLIDAGGVFLTPPPKVRFDLPVVSGLTEDQTEHARAERVRAMSALLEELGPQGKNLSEINVASLEDLRITSELDHHVVELWMGDRNFSSRFQNFMDHFPEIHKHSPQAAVFDLRLDDRITAK